MANISDAEIGLPEVDAVGPAEESDVGAVVDDDVNAARVREFDELSGGVEERAAVERLFAKLEAVGPTGDGATSDVEPIVVLAQRSCDEHAEPPLWASGVAEFED